MKPEPLAVIRLYPEIESTLYARVRIWRTLKDFRAGRPDLTRNSRGACTGHQGISFKGKRARKLPIFCTVELVRDWLGAGTIAHELTHAAIQWADRVGLKGNDVMANRVWYPPARAVQESAKGSRHLKRDSAEERFCYALGEMYRQLAARCHEQGYFK